MSILIDAKSISAVLLSDGWHTVADDSFEIGAAPHFYQPNIGGGSGFQFKERTNNLAGKYAQYSITQGPLSSVLALRTVVPPTNAV
jgi:hypothetical protein